MKVKLIFVVLVVALVVLFFGLHVGAGFKPLPVGLQEQLVHATSFEALALNPIPIRDADKLDTNMYTLLHYPILGHVKVDDQNLRRELIDVVSKDIATANHAPTACILEPHHGIRCVDGSNIIQIAICYHCGDVVVERNGKEEDYLIKMDGALLSPASKQLFDKILLDAGVKTETK